MGKEGELRIKGGSYWSRREGCEAGFQIFVTGKAQRQEPVRWGGRRGL